jgi:CRP-like cAMP-binding protein
VVALTALEPVVGDGVAEAAARGRSPALAAALTRARWLEQSMLLDHMVRLGRQTAYERVAHFLLELQQRMEIAGFGDAQRFPLPLTQEILADVLGLSIVHVNRTLQQLRREKLIELRSGVAILLQPDILASISDFKRAVPVAGVLR